MSENKNYKKISNHDTIHKQIIKWQNIKTNKPTNTIELIPPVKEIELIPSIITKRPIRDGETLAYCAECKELTPMQWLPKAERGKRAEQWFQCEYCGCRELTLRYFDQ